MTDALFDLRHSTIDNSLHYPLTLMALWISLSLPGCSQYIGPNVPEPIRPFIEPQFGDEYLLYRPSSYDRNKAWPVIVVCHSTFPDSPNRRLRAWTELAESQGFLLVAPRLTGNKNSWISGAKKEKKPPDDETHILAVIQHVRAAHNVSDDRILIHGFT